MAKKRPFVLRLRPEMMDALEKWSADEFRSVNGQIEWILNRALREAGRMKDGDRVKSNEPKNKE